MMLARQHGAAAAAAAALAQHQQHHAAACQMHTTTSSSSTSSSSSQKEPPEVPPMVPDREGRFPGGRSSETMSVRPVTDARLKRVVDDVFLVGWCAHGRVAACVAGVACG